MIFLKARLGCKQSLIYHWPTQMTPVASSSVIAITTAMRTIVGKQTKLKPRTLAAPKY